MPILTALLALSLAAPDVALVAERRDRRDRLRAAIGEGAVAVVLAARDDEPFRQDRDFLYLTGLAAMPGAALILEGGKEGPGETLYLPPRDPSAERWNGARLGPGGSDPESGEADAERKASEAETGVARVASLDGLDKALLGHLRRGRALAMVAEPLDREALATPAHLLWRDLSPRAPGAVLRPLRPELNALRVVKSDREMAAIERAVAITLEAQREVAGAVKAGAKEYEVKALLEYVFARNGARTSFASIVASGPDATVLHYRQDRREMGGDELVVVDIGAEWEGYAADVSRTYPTSGRFSQRQREIYDIVLAAQKAALAKVKPGAKLRSDVHAAAKKVIADAGYEKFFPHGTSHYVGLDVHDVGARDGVLAAGMVITVEPGIYLPAEALGVRIEDMVLVTADGYRSLTASLPSSSAEIEALMAASAAGAATPSP